MKNFFTTLVLSLVVFSSNAAADPILNYDFLEATYQWKELSGESVESANGFAGRGSISPIDYLFFEGSYEYYTTKIQGINLNSNTYKVGIGVWEPLSDDLNLVGHGGMAFSEPSGDIGGESDSGGYGGVALRWRLAPAYEFDLSATYTSDLEVNPAIDVTNYLFGTGLLIRTGNHGAISLGFAMDEEATVVTNAGLRLTL